MSANDKQVGGTHYANDSGKQHWDIVAEHDLDYFQGQITKYVMRWKKKGGVQDLKKALHFLEKYIELNEPLRGVLERAFDEGVRESNADLLKVDMIALAELGEAMRPQSAVFSHGAEFIGPGVLHAPPGAVQTVHEHEWAHFNKMVDGRYADWLKCNSCGAEMKNACVSCPD